jgi:hypothetical protein
VVTNLSEKPSTPSTSVIDVDIMVLSIHRLFNKWLFDNNTIDDDSVSIRSQDNVPVFGYDIALLLPPPPFWNDYLSPFFLILSLVTWQYESEFPADSLSKRSRDSWSTIP